MSQRDPHVVEPTKDHPRYYLGSWCLSKPPRVRPQMVICLFGSIALAAAGIVRAINSMPSSSGDDGAAELAITIFFALFMFFAGFFDQYKKIRRVRTAFSIAEKMASSRAPISIDDLGIAPDRAEKYIRSMLAGGLLVNMLLDPDARTLVPVEERTIPRVCAKCGGVSLVAEGSRALCGYCGAPLDEAGR